MRSLALTVVVAVVAGGAPLRADAGTATDGAGGARPAEYRSPAVATLAALGPTLAGGALLGLGLLSSSGTAKDALLVAGIGTLTLGPSAGHFYAGAPKLGLGTTALRIGCVATVAGTIYLTERAWDDTDDGLRIFLVLADVLAVVAGGGSFLAAIGYDVLDAAPAARRHNRRLALTPTLVPSTTGAAPGLSVAGTA